MPPFRDPNRLFYDSENPVMLSQDEIAQLSPAELQAATDQLDQNLVLLLQRIEENFARCNEVVTERILPAVEQHGENSARIFQSIKFWKPFFEAAANISLNDPYGEEASVHTDEPSHATASPERTLASDEGDLTYASHPSLNFDSTPRAATTAANESSAPHEPHWSTDVSPFPALQTDLRASAGPSASADNSALQKYDLPDVDRLQLGEYAPDSPGLAEPQFETINVGAAMGRGGARGGAEDRSRTGLHELSSATGQSEPSFLRRQPGSPASRNPRAGGDKTHSVLLEKILRKGLASPAVPRAHGPGSSTPGAAGKVKFPHDLPQNWDGIANLSTTALDAFPSPIKRRAGDDSMYGAPSSVATARGALMSSPAPASRNALNASTSTLRRYPPSPAPPASAATSYSRTPAKEAARRTVQNVYDSLAELDSPTLELPSALKNPARTMAFSHYIATGAGAGDRSERVGDESPSQRSTVRRSGGALLSDEAAAGAGERDESYASMPSQPSFLTGPIPQRPGTEASLSHHDIPLADFGGGTTANIDVLLGGGGAAPADQYAGIVDDDTRPPFGSHSGGDESFTGEEDPHGAYGVRPSEPTYTEGFDEGYSRDGDELQPLGGAGGHRALRLPGQDGPEDTLFGMPPARGAGAAAAQAASRRVTYADPHGDSVDGQGEGGEDDSFDEEARRSGFRLHGLSEMETLHGGELLSSEPFQASPLAGRSHQ
ncbi:DASH complex subunit ASK1 [Rhodotorula paludigena]|uniref:DASH complex subunit ASK1 n=1 Tax=Rhodotorula paludigena TaxID=86838 RepID=UPI00316F2C01